MSSRNNPKHRFSSTISNQSLVLSMTIEIGDGRKGCISVNPSDDPQLLASQFSSTFNLKEIQKEHLALLIKQKIDENFKQLPNSDISRISPENSSRNNLQTRSTNVENRIYTQTIKKRTPTEVIAMKYNRPNTISNYKYNLYEKGKKFLLKKKMSNEIKFEENIEIEKAEICTFKPQINQYSNVFSSREMESTVKLLHEKGKIYERNREYKRAVSEEKQRNECPFSPKILKLSKKSSNQTPRHEVLYQEAAERKERRSLENFNSQKRFSFKPNTQIKRKKSSLSETEEEFADRLIRAKKNKEEKLEKERKKVEHEELNPNGKPLFFPKVESNTINRNPEEIFEKLFQQSFKPKPSLTQNSKPNMICNEKSQKVFNNFKGKQYAYLFNILDSDLDGIISADSIDIESLDIKTLDILTPLFIELDEGRKMGISEFIQTVEKIEVNLTVEERKHLFRRPPKSRESEFGKKVLISTRSSDLAKNKRALMSPALHERLENEQEIAEMMLEKKREIELAEELQKCTFRPNLTKSRKGK